MVVREESVTVVMTEESGETVIKDVDSVLYDTEKILV